jgi:HEAT repeat protein
MKDRLQEEWERVLAAAGIDLTVGGLTAALRSPQMNIRTGAAIILGRRRETSALPSLKPLLDDQPMVRVEAAMALALLGDESGKETLIQMLDDNLINGVPVTAAGYLAVLGDPRGYQVVLQALKSDLSGFRLTAAVALRSFLRYHSREAGGNRFDLFSTVTSALKDPSAIVRRELLYILASFPEPETVDYLADAARTDRNSTVRLVARHLLATKKRSLTKKPSLRKS